MTRIEEILLHDAELTCNECCNRQTLINWAKEYGCDYRTAAGRIRSNGALRKLLIPAMVAKALANPNRRLRAEMAALQEP